MRESKPSRQDTPPSLGILGRGKGNLSSIIKCKLSEKEEMSNGFVSGRQMFPLEIDCQWSPVILEPFCTSQSFQCFNFNVHFSKLLIWKPWDILSCTVTGYSAGISMTPAGF